MPNQIKIKSPVVIRRIMDTNCDPESASSMHEEGAIVQPIMDRREATRSRTPFVRNCHSLDGITPFGSCAYRVTPLEQV